MLRCIAEAVTENPLISGILGGLIAALIVYLITRICQARRTIRSGLNILSPSTRNLPPNAESPSELLMAQHETVAFQEQARQAEINTLDQWCLDKSEFSVRLFTGQGGFGKTRLFVEYTKRLRQKGWIAGFLPEDLSDREAEVLLACQRPVFAVLDYAESKRKLRSFLEKLATGARGRKIPLKVALLAREEGDWWQALKDKSNAELRDILAEYEPVALTAVPLQGELRRRVYDEAWERYADMRGVKGKPPEMDLSDKRFERMLYIHMAALASVERCDIHAESLLTEIVHHEKRLWEKRYRAEHAKDDLDAQVFQKEAARMVAAVTLLGGVSSEAEATALNGRVDGPREEKFVLFLHNVYPGGRGSKTEEPYIAKLEPDLLGEELVTQVMRAAETSNDFLTNVLEGAAEGALENAFTVLGRIGLRDDESGTKWIRQAFDADTHGRLMPAFRAAMSLGKESAHSPLGHALAETLEKAGTVEIARGIESDLPEETVSLREVCLWTAVTILRSLPKDGGSRPERAQLLNSLGVRLSRLGRREEALAAIGEAVEIRRALAKDRPGAFLPDLAMSLNSLGTRLSQLGRREQALAATGEAVEHYRALAKNRPDAFLPNLAMSLHGLGIGLSRLGRMEEALEATREAVEIRRALAKDRPDAFLPDLAKSLGPYGTALSRMGRHEEAARAFHEGLERVAPILEKYPQALGGLAARLAKSYLEALKNSGGKPDDALLGRVKAAGKSRQK